MFDLANDRLSYGELLRPDAGYTLDFAVGTTYSLDLEALLGVPGALGLLDDPDEDILRSPLYVLEAIRKSADKIAVFCNAGGIKLPNKIQSVFSLLENSVFQVKNKNDGNFHPKIWVLKYSQSGKPTYIKLLVMSRNLTFDCSIDISAALQGEVGEKENEKNQPLADFLYYISGFADKKKKQEIQALAHDVRKVVSFDVEPFFNDYDFFPIGIKGWGGSDFPLFASKTKLFAVSPFLSDETVQKMTQFDGEKCLVTRKSSVTPAVMKAFRHVYVTKDALNDDERGNNQDIHAKIYYTSTWNGNYLYLGSANASHNAFYKNVEFMLRLRYKPYYAGFKKFSEDFVPKENCPYDALEGVPEQQAEDARKNVIDKAFKEAVYALDRATVSHENENNRYLVTVCAKPVKTAEAITLAPLQRPDLVKPLDRVVQFPGMLLKELSELYVLSIGSQSLIVKIDTRDIPEDRDKEIYRSIIDSAAKFKSYLLFVLSGDLSEGSNDTSIFTDTVIQANGDALSGKTTVALYEQMLRVFHRDPKKIEDVSKIIEKLDPTVVGQEFLKMFEPFKTAKKKVRK